MLNKADIEYIENAVGYTFKDKSLLVRAFTHASYTEDDSYCYENLEFLGDSIVGFVVAEKLFSIYPKKDEGALTKMRINIVSEKPLARAIESIRISDKMIFGIGETKLKIHTHSSIKCDLFEAITGAIYLDGGMDEAKKFVLTMLENDIANAEEKEDNKSALNEYGSKHEKSIEYVLLDTSGPSHKPTFTWAVLVNGIEYGRGKGGSKSEAQQLAAKRALEKIGGEK